MRYLHQLELAAKQRVGVVPEDMLTDAREFLSKDLQSLQQSEPGIEDEEIYRHFLTTFGLPDDVARQYEDVSKKGGSRFEGVAPHWRICCTKCGRSAPAAKAGITRMGARSSHKYVVGWCRDCRWLRWLRLERDLDQANLCQQLAVELTGEQLRQRKHKPVQVVLLALAISLVAAVLFPMIVRQVLKAANAAQVADATFAAMPANWTVDRHQVVSPGNLQAISRKLGGSIVAATNTVIRDQGRSLQINRLRCKRARDAGAVQRALLDMKLNPLHVARNGLDVYEFVCRTPEAGRFAIEARYRLPIQPQEAKYRVQFDAIPIAGGNPMAWNRLFNLFLLWHSGQDRDDVESQIAKLSGEFQFSDELVFKNTGLGSTETQWRFNPQPSVTSQASVADATRYKFASLPMRTGVPVVRVQAIVTSTTFGTTSVADPEARPMWLQANKFWPADSPEIAQLARQITAGVTSDEAKVAALLAWFGKETNIRFAGETGSRYGTLKVLQQKHGHCWDYADLLITLCRASGIPARQVFGWLHHGEGHVWAEVLIDNQWHPFDPTTGSGCGSDYVPLVTSADGRMPLVYASPVNIELLQAR